jgi:hypothetical protein
MVKERKVSLKGDEAMNKLFKTGSTVAQTRVSSKQ